MRRITRLAVLALVATAVAMPAASAGVLELDGPDPAIWVSDPEGVDGNNGIEQGDPVAGISGSAKVTANGAHVKVGTTGLVPGHTYTMWLVYFNDQRLCADGCNGPDLGAAGGGVQFGNGQVAGEDGTATFAANIRRGDGAELVPSGPPPPFAMAAYEPDEHNEFHVIIRSHGPRIPGEVGEQISLFNGGCDVQVGPLPGQLGDFPVPAAPGECGDVQVFFFK